MTDHSDDFPKLLALWERLWDYLPSPEGGGSEDQEPQQGQGQGDQDRDQETESDGIGTETAGSEPDDGPEDPETEGDEDDDEDSGDFGDEDPDLGDVADEHEGEVPGPEYYEPKFTPHQLPLLGFRRDGENYIRDFHSWTSFVECVADETLYAWNDRGSYERHASHSNDMESWSGGKSFNDIVTMALRTGWPEGRQMLYDALTLVAPRPKNFSNQEYEVAGAYPCVPIYCAGDPACMVQDGSSIRNQRPVISIDYNNYVHAGVRPEDMILRGAAIISLADSLERQGFSTELRIIGNMVQSRGTGDRVFRYNITYKKAGEPLDIDRAALAIAHPGSMRRLAFALLEQHADLRPFFEGGYGRPMYQANDPTSGKFGGPIFVPGSKGRETQDSAQAAVEIAARTLLQTLIDEAAD